MEGKINRDFVFMKKCKCIHNLVYLFRNVENTMEYRQKKLYNIMHASNDLRTSKMIRMKWSIHEGKGKKWSIKQ